MSTLIRILTVALTLSCVSLVALTGCGLYERLEQQEAHLAALDSRLDAQDRFLEVLRTDMFLEIRKIRDQLRGLDKFVNSMNENLWKSANDAAARAKALEDVVNRLQGIRERLMK